MAKKEKKAKPTVAVDIVCPCGKKLHVAIFRKRTNESVKAEYDVWHEVTEDEQGTLPGMDEGGDSDTTVTESE